jgi:hypothetical protein
MAEQHQRTGLVLLGDPLLRAGDPPRAEALQPFGVPGAEVLAARLQKRPRRGEEPAARESLSFGEPLSRALLGMSGWVPGRGGQGLLAGGAGAGPDGEQCLEFAEDGI